MDAKWAKETKMVNRNITKHTFAKPKGTHRNSVAKEPNMGWWFSFGLLKKPEKSPIKTDVYIYIYMCVFAFICLYGCQLLMGDPLVIFGGHHFGGDLCPPLLRGFPLRLRGQTQKRSRPPRMSAS